MRLQKAIGGTVKVQGFIENLRNSKYMAFIVLKDSYRQAADHGGKRPNHPEW